MIIELFLAFGIVALVSYLVEGYRAIRGRNHVEEPTQEKNLDAPPHRGFYFVLKHGWKTERLVVGQKIWMRAGWGEVMEGVVGDIFEEVALPVARNHDRGFKGPAIQVDMWYEPDSQMVRLGSNGYSLLFDKYGVQLLFVQGIYNDPRPDCSSSHIPWELVGSRK